LVAVKGIGVWAVGLGLSVAVARVALAQPQDDAALADDQDERATPRDTMSGSYGSKSAPEPEQELEPVMSTEGLRRAYPDLELLTTPPPTLTVGMSGVYPFLDIAIGVGFDVYALSRLRLSGFAAGGMTYTVARKWAGGDYAELGVGVTLMRWGSQTTVELPVVAARFHRKYGDVGPIARAILPSSHSLELEAGAITAYDILYRCTSRCNDLDYATFDSVGSQLLLPYAGLRYAYYRRATSQQAPFRSTSRFQLAADLLINPLKAPDLNLYTPLRNHPGNSPVGARVVFRFPAFRCAILGPCFGLDLTGGYLPKPSDLLLSVGFTLY
jgi:hypothetical protein